MEMPLCQGETYVNLLDIPEGNRLILKFQKADSFLHVRFVSRRKCSSRLDALSFSSKDEDVATHDPEDSLVQRPRRGRHRGTGLGYAALDRAVGNVMSGQLCSSAAVRSQKDQRVG
eukprot:s1829_g3.t1